MNNGSGNYIDWNNEWSYPLQWLWESMPARQIYQEWIYRTDLAMQGKPFKNLYQEEMNSNLKVMTRENQARYKKVCQEMPEGHSFSLYQAVETIANQLASGVDTYEYQINDPYMIVEDDTEALLSAKCQEDYINNELGLFASLYTKDELRYGMVAVMVTYDPKHNRNIVERVHPKNCWFDTRYSSTGRERFRAYSTMISFAKLKDMIESGGDEVNNTLEVPDRSIFDKDGKILKAKYRNHKIKTLNDLDIYVQDLNKLAVAPDLQGYTNIYWEYDHDLRTCYNLGWYHTFATNPKEQTNSGYNGDDVELTVLYDLDRGIEFKIINRRFVISLNRKAFKRSLIFPIYNPATDEYQYRVDEVRLQCPLKFRFYSMDTMDKFAYPTTPVFNLLHTHDQLCAWWAKRNHVAQILSILRLEANGADAEALRGVMNIMGVVIDRIQSDINSLIFDYSFDPIDSQIEHLEMTIQKTLSAYTEFDAMQAMGDRASAAESGMAVSAIAQGLATIQNSLMSLYADIARQCILNRVVYSNLQEFPVNNLGNYSAVTIQQMALDAVINVKPKLAKQAQEKQLAANAMALAANFKDVLSSEGVAYLIEQALYGNVPRKVAATFLKPQGPSSEEVQAAQLQAQNQAMQLAQNQAMYEQNPLPYEAGNVMQNYAPEEVDQIIGSLSTPNGSETFSETGVVEGEEVNNPELLDMQSQQGALAMDMAGMTSELGAELANPNSMV